MQKLDFGNTGLELGANGVLKLGSLDSVGLQHQDDQTRDLEL